MTCSSCHLVAFSFAPSSCGSSFASAHSGRWKNEVKKRPGHQRVKYSLMCSSRDLYKDIGLEKAQAHNFSQDDLRKAYLSAAKAVHPDASSSSDSFPKVAYAWSILSDPEKRAIYDTTGIEGINAIESMQERTEDLKNRYEGLDSEELDFLSESGQLLSGVLSPSAANIPAMADVHFDPNSVNHEDACPRSVEEAIWNIQHHEDSSVRYYGLWWIYKFKVPEAEQALVHVLGTSEEKTSLGGFGIRRRAALALGAVASMPTRSNTAAVLELTNATKSSDYFLRYRAAEALATIAQRYADAPDCQFPDEVLSHLLGTLRVGMRRTKAKEEASSGYSKQEGLFDLEKLQPDVRARLEAIFEDRRENEKKSRRTTMTPQLGVDEIDNDKDEPFEWILKAVGAIASSLDCQKSLFREIFDLLKFYTTNSVPLVKYAAHKALFAITKTPKYAEALVSALGYGIEHHYSQRVLIRDLGDLGYAPGAEFVAKCPMVENSFKVLALKNMLAKRSSNPDDPDVRNVLKHMDSLL